MITGIDHVVIAVRDLEAGVAAYETLLGCAPSWRSSTDGADTAIFALRNIAVELMAPAGEGEAARRLRAALDESGEGLKSLVFAVADIERAHRRAGRVGLEPEPIASRESVDAISGATQSWRSFRANTDATHGARLFFLQREAPLPLSAGGDTVLDHVVLRSGHMERAAALCGARLGLELRLEREMGGRLYLFFRCADAIVEIAEETGAMRDRVWGLSWRVDNADAAHARLAAAGLDISEVRAGMKPGTRVFTVRNGSCGVPTLMLEASPKRD